MLTINFTCTDRLNFVTVKYSLPGRGNSMEIATMPQTMLHRVMQDMATLPYKPPYFLHRVCFKANNLRLSDLRIVKYYLESLFHII